MCQINPNEVLQKGIIANVALPESQVQQNGIDLTLAVDVELHPHEFINVGFNESFNMKDCYGIVNIRSSFSRKGIFSSSGIYDDGFAGIGGCSLYSFAKEPIKISKGTRIAQMLVFKSNAAKKYTGVYNTKKDINSKL